MYIKKIIKKKLTKSDFETRKMFDDFVTNFNFRPSSTRGLKPNSFTGIALKEFFEVLKILGDILSLTLRREIVMTTIYIDSRFIDSRNPSKKSVYFCLLFENFETC